MQYIPKGVVQGVGEGRRLGPEGIGALDPPALVPVMENCCCVGCVYVRVGRAPMMRWDRNASPVRERERNQPKQLRKTAAKPSGSHIYIHTYPDRSAEEAERERYREGR
jgi:hypothetical protein